MSTIINRPQIPIPIFSGENYEYWATKMRTYFMSQGLWDIVQTRYTIPENPTSLSVAEKEKLNKSMEKDSLALTTFKWRWRIQYF